MNDNSWPNSSSSSSTTRQQERPQTAATRLEDATREHIKTLRADKELLRQRNLGLEQENKEFRGIKEAELKSQSDTISKLNIKNTELKGKLDQAESDRTRARSDATIGAGINVVCLLLASLSAAWALSDDQIKPDRLPWLVVAGLLATVGIAAPLLLARRQ